MAHPAAVETIIQNLQEAQQVPPRPGVIALTDWSDEKLDNLASTITVPRSVKEMNLYPSLLFYFYDFYFNGRLPQGYSPHQIVYPFLSSLAYGEGEQRNYFISEARFGPHGFFTLPPALANIPELELTNVAAAEQYIPQNLSAEERQAIANLYFAQSEPDRIIFKNAINHMIRGFDILRHNPDNSKILQLTGFISLLLFRGISKDPTQLSRGVNKKLIKEHIHNLVGWPVANAYFPPCKTCVENCSLDFNKGNNHANKMMTLILSAWKRVVEGNTETYGLVPQVQAALLTHTAGNGLGLVMLLYTACEYLGITISDLMRHTLTDQSLASWNVLSEFLQKYLNRLRPERTYMWARLISDGYFTEYAARSHPYLAGMFAGIIGYQQTVGSIKQAVWFTSKRHQAENGYTWGRAVVSKLSQRVDRPFLPEGEAVQAFLEHPDVAPAHHVVQAIAHDPFAAIELEHQNNNL